MEYLSLAVLAIAGVLLLSLIFKIFKTPIKLALKLLLNAGLGFLALLLINFFGEPLGIALGVNWINAIVIGLLGVPGAIVLVVLNFIL